MSSGVLTKWPELGKSKKNDEVLGQRGLATVGEGTEGCMTALEEGNVQGARGGRTEVVGVEKNKSQQWQHTRKPFLSLNFNPL